MEILSLIVILVFFGLVYFLFKGEKHQIPAENGDDLANIAEQILYVHNCLPEIDRLIAEEHYEDAIIECNKLNNVIANPDVFYRLYTIHNTLNDIYEAVKYLAFALRFTDKASDKYCYWLVEYIAILFESGYLQDVIENCALYEKELSRRYPEFTNKIKLVHEDSINKLKNKDLFIEQFENNQIDISTLVERLIENNAYTTALQLLDDDTDLAEFESLEFLLKISLCLRSNAAKEYAFKLYDANVHSHLVFQTAYEFSGADMDGELQNKVLQDYENVWGESEQYKLFSSGLI